MNQPAAPMSAHRQEACEHLSPLGKKFFPYIEFDDQEELLSEVRKHPLGEIIILFTGAIVAVVIATLTIALAGNLDILNTVVTDTSGSFQNVVLTAGFFLTVLSVLATAIPVYIYRANVIFITNEKIAEVAYVSLFNRKITQLAVGNVENVTYAQKGILPRIFDYGTLIVETAAETENLTFSYVPKPNSTTQIIVTAHEEYVKKYGN